MSDAELIARLRDGCNLQQRDGERAAKRIEQLIATNEELLAERKKDHANINLKADFIDKTINQLAEAEAKLAECEARLGKAVEALHNAAFQLDWCQAAREISKEIDATLAEIKLQSSEFATQKGESHD